MRITFVPLCHTHRARAILDADSLQAASQSTKLGGAWDMGQRSRLCCLNWVAKQIGSKFKCDKNQHENAAGTPKAVWEQEQLKSASSGCFLAWLPLTPHCPPGSRSYCIENLNISILIDKLSMMLAQSSDLGQHTSSLLWLCAHTKCYCKLWEFPLPPSPCAAPPSAPVPVPVQSCLIYVVG